MDMDHGSTEFIAFVALVGLLLGGFRVIGVNLFSVDSAGNGYGDY